MGSRFVKIRKAKVDDYTICLPLLGLLYHGDIGPHLKQTFEEFVDGRESTVLLAEHAGGVAGILIGSYHLDMDWEGKIAKIDSLVVEEAYRSKGIGRELVRNFITTARTRHCRAVKSRVNRKNAVAQKFHESLGFIEAKTYEYILSLDE